MKNLIPALFVLAFAAPSVHAQSQSGANPYNVPMFAGHVGHIYAEGGAPFSDKQWTNTTAPELAYSTDHRRVEITGVALAHGHPLRSARVELMVTLDIAGDGTDFFRRTTQTDQDGVYRVTYIEPAEIEAEVAEVREMQVISAKSASLGYEVR